MRYGDLDGKFDDVYGVYLYFFGFSSLYNILVKYLTDDYCKNDCTYFKHDIKYNIF